MTLTDNDGLERRIKERKKAFAERQKIFGQRNLLDAIDAVYENKNDYIVVNVQNYDLAELNPLINNETIRFAGPIEGRVRVKNIYEIPLIFADINSPRLSFNDTELGKLNLRSFWDNQEKAEAGSIRFKSLEDYCRQRK